MLWFGIAIVGMFGLLVYVARFLRFEERGAEGTRDAGVRVSRVRTQQEIVVRTPDGQECRYTSVEDMPPELRAVIETARKQARGRIVLNEDGVRHEYGKLDEAPPETRQRIRALQDAPSREGILIEVDGETHCFASAQDVPPRLRRFLDEN